MRSEYLLTDIDTEVAAPVVATQDEAGMVLYRTSGEAVVRQRVEGLYADRRSGGQVRFWRSACMGGTAVARLAADPELHRQPVPVQAVVEGAGGQYSAIVRPGTPVVMRVPLIPQRGVCEVTYTMPTVSPAEVSESSDVRQLGLQFSFEYEAPG